ncbi:hypothetical protein HYU95_02030 [Candidatus Daviesbacteria bacterium]|nr:hypothetical protein [Candidatus Daviesbacteria bacterium]
MILKLTCKNCQISSKIKQYIDKHLKKITRLLPGMKEDLVVFKLIIRRNIDKYYPAKTRTHRHRSYADIRPALAYFEGAATFRLGKRQLYAHFKGQAVKECIDRGFDLIFRKLKQYKDLHFRSESQYPDHNSIRDGRLSLQLKLQSVTGR